MSLIYSPEKMMIDMGGHQIRLDNHLARIMELLYMSPGEVCTPDDIGVALYGVDGWYDGPLQDTVIEKYISRLRKRMDPHGFDYIKTVRSVGWYFSQYEPDSITSTITPDEAQLLRYFRQLDPIDQAMVMASQSMAANEAEAKRLAVAPRVTPSFSRPEQLLLFEY